MEKSAISFTPKMAAKYWRECDDEFLAGLADRSIILTLSDQDEAFTVLSSLGVMAEGDEVKLLEDLLEKQKEIHTVYATDDELEGDVNPSMDEE